MNILHISSAFYPGFRHGGIIPALHELCRNLAVQGCHVKVLTTDAAGDGTAMDVDCEREVEMDARYRIRYCRYLMSRSVSPMLLRLLPHYVRWADVVHLSSVYNFPTIPTLLLCRLMGKPVVWSPHGALQRWKGSRRQGVKWMWNLLCRAIAPPSLCLHVTSEEEAAVSNRVFPSASVAEIPYCVPIPPAVSRVERSRSLRLLYLGRLDPKKGIENLLEACTLLTEKKFPFSLTIAGAGEPAYTTTLHEKTSIAERSGAAVKMVGEVLAEAKERLLAEADALVVPSHTENFGVVVAEALLREVPVIAGRGTPWKRLEDVGCGLWVANDPRSLADAIERISRLPLRDMGRRGRAWVQKEFDPVNIGQTTLAWYQRLLNRHPSLP